MTYSKTPCFIDYKGRRIEAPAIACDHLKKGARVKPFHPIYEYTVTQLTQDMVLLEPYSRDAQQVFEKMWQAKQNKKTA